MQLAGRRSREMVGRYAASAADERARAAFHRAALGNRLWTATSHSIRDGRFRGRPGADCA